MKKLGEGWDYTVYEIAANRVQKIRKNKAQLALLLLRTVNIIPLFKVLSGQKIQNAITPSCQLVQNLLQTNPELGWFFGNPLFGENDSYTQDKVVSLREYFHTHSFEENKKVLDGYIGAIEFMWQYHFSDTSFKFSKNYGIDQHGSVMLIDFSNLTQEKSVIEKLLQENFLTRVWVYRKMLNSKLKRYYREAVQGNLTIAKLQSLWI